MAQNWSDVMKVTEQEKAQAFEQNKGLVEGFKVGKIPKENLFGKLLTLQVRCNRMEEKWKQGNRENNRWFLISYLSTRELRRQIKDAAKFRRIPDSEKRIAKLGRWELLDIAAAHHIEIV